jgi:hypothetical protein
MISKPPVFYFCRQASGTVIITTIMRRSFWSLKILFASVWALIFLLSALPAIVLSASISQSFSADQAIKGSLVSLDSARRDFVEPANSSNASRLVGVAVSTQGSLLAVDPSDSKIQIATTGDTEVLVSTVAGDIKVGDQIAVSSFNGVGMKATSPGYIIGVAQSEFNEKTEGTQKQSVNDTEGNPREISTGYTRVNIAISNTNEDASVFGQLNGLQKLGRALTGHVISTPRLITAIVIAVVALCAVIALVYASIYGSIIAIGRNPLSKFAVFHTLRSVVMMILVIVFFAAFLIFFILR